MNNPTIQLVYEDGTIVPLTFDWLANEDVTNERKAFALLTAVRKILDTPDCASIMEHALKIKVGYDYCLSNKESAVAPQA